MTLKQLRARWDELARRDAMWAVLTEPGKENGAWNEQEFYKTGEADFGHVLAVLKRYDVDITCEKALDFGCGLGRLTAALATQFNAVDAIDISAEMIARAKRLREWPRSVAFYQSSDTSLHLLGADSYDFILSLIAIQHVPQENALKYIASFCRLLKPGGVAYLQMTTFLDPQSKSALAKLGRDESYLNRLYRRLVDLWSPKKDLMSTFYCRLSETLQVLEQNRMKLIAVFPEPIKSGDFIFHSVVFKKPASVSSSR